jgi:hypothetical protein
MNGGPAARSLGVGNETVRSDHSPRFTPPKLSASTFASPLGEANDMPRSAPSGKGTAATDPTHSLRTFRRVLRAQQPPGAPLALRTRLSRTIANRPPCNRLLNPGTGRSPRLRFGLVWDFPAHKDRGPKRPATSYASLNRSGSHSPALHHPAPARRPGIFGQPFPCFATCSAWRSTRSTFPPRILWISSRP